MAESYPPSQTWSGEPPTGPPPVAPLPWEDPEQPFLEALFETAKLFVLAPQNAYSRMQISGDLGRPLLWAVIFGWIGIIASQAYDLAFRGAMWQFMPGMDRAAAVAMPVAVSVTMMVLAPVFVLLGVFLWSAILHLMLLILGGAANGFAATLRVVAYTGTSNILNVIPFCGGLLAAVWGMVLAVIGLAASHRISTGKAVLAVLLPLLLCCACVIAAVAAAAALGFGIFTSLR